MSNIQAAIFDMDGLLIDSERASLAVYQQSCQHFGLHDEVSLHALFLSCIGTNKTENDRRFHAALQDQVDVTEFLAYWGGLYQAYQNEHTIPVKEGVFSLLDALEKRGVPAAVATSTKTPFALKKLEKCDLLHRFETVTGGDQVAKSKPEPDIFLKAASSISVAPEHCLAFEDSYNGVHAAVAAGMQVYQVPDLLQPDETLQALGHNIVNSLEEVEALIWGQRI